MEKGYKTDLSINNKNTENVTFRTLWPFPQQLDDPNRIFASKKTEEKTTAKTTASTLLNEIMRAGNMTTFIPSKTHSVSTVISSTTSALNLEDMLKISNEEPFTIVGNKVTNKTITQILNADPLTIKTQQPPR